MKIEKQSSEIKSAYFNNFVLQVVFSTLPTSIIVVFLPVYLQYLDINYSVLGFIFMFLRISSIFSSFLTPYLLKRFPAYLLSANAEILNLLLISVAIIAIYFKLNFLFILSIALKGISVGTINTCRFSWLKALENTEISKLTLTVVTSIYQSTYALAGILYLFYSEIHYAIVFLYIDALSSLAGFFLFMGLSKIPIIVNYEKTRFNDFLFLFKKPFCYLALIDFLFYFSLGGSNILLVKYGNKYLNEWGGYGTALIIYGVFYFLGGALINRYKNPYVIEFLLKKNIIIIGIFIGFLSLFLAKYFSFFGVIGVCLIFFFSPIFSLILQIKWFEISPVDKAPHFFATRTFCIQILGALGESIYGIISNDIFIRGFLLLLLFLATHYVSRKLPHIK